MHARRSGEAPSHAKWVSFVLRVCENAGWGRGGGGVYDPDIIVTSVVIALLGVKFGGLLPRRRNIFGALKRLPRAS